MAPACQALGLSRASYYRRKNPAAQPEAEPTARPCRVKGRALTPTEQQQVLDTLSSERFRDLAVR